MIHMIPVLMLLLSERLVGSYASLTPDICEKMPIVPGFGNNRSHNSGCAIRHFQQDTPAADPSACRAACCAEDECRSWGLDMRYPFGGDSSCALDKPCCWLERCTGLSPEYNDNCSYGCVSGKSGRVDDPASCLGCTATSCRSCPAPPPRPPAACPHASAPANVARTGCDVKQVATSNYSACAAACCADATCVAWN